MSSQRTNPVPEVESISLIPFEEVGSQAGRMAEMVTTWQNDHYEKYDPLVWADKEKRRVRRKAFCEASFYLLFLDKFGKGDRAPELTDFIVETVNDREFFELLPREPDKLLKHGYPFVYVKSRGELGEQAQAVLDQTLASKTPWSRERAPHRQLDLYYFLQELDLDPDVFDPETIIKYSNAHHQPDLVEVNVRQLYALTHNVMYYTDFGIGSEGFPDTTVPYDLSTTLAGLTLRCMANRDTDATVELLMCGVIQRQMDPEFVQFVCSWLREVSKDYDTIPGPGLQEFGAIAPDETAQTENKATLGDWSDEQEEWVQHYHTAVAAGLCFNVIERDWDDLVETGPTRSLDYERHADQLFELGKLIHQLSEYELDLASVTMQELADSPVVEAYDDVFEACRAFLERQRTYDDQVGFWTNERYLYVAGGGGTEASFESDLMQPCTDRCEEALEAASKILDR